MSRNYNLLDWRVWVIKLNSFVVAYTNGLDTARLTSLVAVPSHALTTIIRYTDVELLLVTVEGKHRGPKETLW